MTEKETKTDTGAQSAPKPKTFSEAEREALLFPEAAKIKQAARDRLLKSAGNKPRRNSGKRLTSMNLSPAAFELVEAARRRGLTMTSFIELSLAAYAASCGLASPGNADRGKFNPEIETLIGSYQATNHCDRETAIQGLLIQGLRIQPTLGGPADQVVSEITTSPAPQLDAPPLDAVLTPPQTAAWLQIPESVLARKTRAGIIPSISLGHKTRRYHVRTIMAKFAIDAGVKPQVLAASFELARPGLDPKIGQG
jgi:hypothetical protein